MWNYKLYHICVTAVILFHFQYSNGNTRFVAAKINANNCLNLHNKCNKADDNCQLDIIITKKMCGDYLEDDSIFSGCNRDNEESCRGAIKTMNQKHEFSQCHCDNTYFANTEQYQKCQLIWRLLNQHPCILNPPLYLSKNPSKDQNGRFKDNSRSREIDSKELQKNEENSKIMRRIYKLLKTMSLREILGSMRLFAESQTIRSNSVANSCIAKQAECHQNQNCYVAWTNFNRNCKFKTCDKNGDLCITSYQILRQYGMFDCSCVKFHQNQSSNMKICLTIQSNLRDNECLAFLNNRVMYQTLLFTNSDNTNSPVEIIMPKNLKNLQFKTPNCLDSYQLCIQSAQCLQRYIEVEKQCNRNNDQSCLDYDKCLRAVRNFYSRPDSITLNSVRCRCNAQEKNTNNNDVATSCLRQKSVFQPKCVKTGFSDVARPSHSSPKPINCLKLMVHCLNDTACLDSFTVFNQLCSPVYLSNKANCRKHYFKCLDAYRTIWGTILTTKCSCEPDHISDFVTNPYQWAKNSFEVCTFFQNMVTQPQCPEFSDQENELTKLDQNPNSRIEHDNNPCSMIRKHNLPKDGYIRLRSQSHCPLVCKCQQKCFYLSCRQMGTNYYYYSNNDTNLLYPYLDHCDSFRTSPTLPCKCYLKSVQCQSLYNSDYKSTDYKLIVTYNIMEFILIRKSNLIGGINTITDNLNNLMTVTTGFKNCKLTFQDAHEAYLTFLLEINVNKIHSSQLSLSDSSYLGYYILSKKEQLKHMNTECVMSLKLLQIMINRHYAEIIHNLPLSILQKADIIVPPQLNGNQLLKHQQNRPNNNQNNDNNNNNNDNNNNRLVHSSSNQAANHGDGRGNIKRNENSSCSIKSFFNFYKTPLIFYISIMIFYISNR